MKLKRLISCGLVGILTGVGILMNAKVSSAEDKSVKYTIASSASVTASGQVIEGSNASFKNTYSTKEQITKDNSMTFKLTNIDGIKVSKIVMKTHTNKSKGAGTIKIDIGEGNLYSGNYTKSFSTSYSDYEFDVKALKNVDYMFGDISIVMSCTVNSLYCQSYTIYYFEGEPTKSYPVTFYDGEAELTDLACNVEENGKITKPADPVKEGYIFDAWYKESTFDNKWDFENDIVAADTKLYAKFLPEAEVTKYNVTFKSDENTVINTVTVKEGNSVGEPENPVKDGYQFDGWYTDVNCTDKYDFNTVVSADLTLYAKWLAKYTVSFDTDGGSTVESQTVVTEKKVELSKPKKTYFEPKMVDDEFQFVINDSFSFQFNPGSPRFTAYKLTSKLGNLVLYKAKGVTPINVTYKDLKGNELAKDQLLPKQKPSNLKGPALPGHKFVGWCKEGTDTIYDFNAEIQEDVVLVAKYEALTPAELFEQLEIKNQLAYHWQTEDGTTYTIDNVSLRFGVNLTEEMKSLEGVKFGAILAKKTDVANINLSEYARACASAAEVVGKDEKLKYLEFTNIAAEGGMTSLRLDNLDSALAEEFVVVIYMEYNGKLYLTEATIGSFKSIASEYLNLNLDLSQDVINSLTQIVK